MFLEADEEKLFFWLGDNCFLLILHEKDCFFCLFYFSLNIRKKICKVHILGSAPQLMLNERQVLLNH